MLPAEIAGGQPLGYASILNALLVHGQYFLPLPDGAREGERVPRSGCPTGMRRKITAPIEGFENTSDLEMWLRIARLYHVGVLEDHLLRYRRGHGSASERYHHIRTEPFRFFQTFIDAELERLRPTTVATTRSPQGVRGTPQRRPRTFGPSTTTSSGTSRRHGSRSIRCVSGLSLRAERSSGDG